MALTKISTDTIDLSSDTTALKMPKGTTTQRPDVLTVDYLVVAGGGGGGWLGGGGGAGGYLTDSVSLSTSSAYSVIIGAGGSGGNSGSPGGGSGANSKFTSSIEAIGGGSGGGHSSTAPGIGGSGGGGPSSGNFYNGAAGTTGQGNSGGDNVGNFTPGYGAGGGGGAGSAGVNGTSTAGGNGGDGLQNNIDGNNYFYAGGGGGGVQLTNTAGTGGSSIGGDGGNDGNAGSDASPANRGSGGGGGGYSSAGVYADGGDGSDGIIIISVPVNYTATFTSGVTANGVSGGGAISPNTATGYNVWVITVTTNALQTVTFSGTAPTIGTTRENTTTGKMEIYTGAKGWRALQQTGQDVGIVPSDNFNTVLYTGNAVTRNIEVGFQPDFVWLKSRDSARNNRLFDSVRGATKGLYSDLDYAEFTEDSLIAFDTNGFTLGTAGNQNVSSEEYVSWNWKGGGAPTVSNPFMIDGTGYATAAAATLNTGNSTPSSVSINTSVGFSIIEVTTTAGSAYTVAHGLGIKPALTIWKRTNVAENWWVYLSDDLFSYASGVGYLVLNGTDAIANDTGAAAFTTSLMPQPTTGVKDYISYTFASIPNYSLISTYTGTGSATNSPIIYTGFKPAWILIKNVDRATASWVIADDKRDPTSPFEHYLFPDYVYGTYTSAGDVVNYYDNGFQISGTGNFLNEAGSRFLFMCFAS